ncbi:perivitellin-2 67 kDa subunit [Aplysia californica]|uniref:Perivitellin-2 67 kDa subunit n=1 Tax=Aplysia californica TaxID=6500 RepID=A0ABM0KAM8_APLCA|nr:perivitellin-2 67 kDa subunit [Aplysia californica]
MDLLAAKTTALLLAFQVTLLTGSAMATTECSTPLPGVRKMVTGVDITELDLVPLDFRGSRGIRSPVINFTCNRDRSWISETGVPFQLPDQVWHTSSVPGGWISSYVQIYKTSSEVRRNLQQSVGGESSIWKFSFSASRSYTMMQDTITNESRYISDVSAFESAKKVRLIPSLILNLDHIAQMFLDHLVTGNFSSNPDAYRLFINEFGTHYFSTGEFGGYIRVLHETDTSYFHSHTDRQVETNARAAFMSVISANGGRVSGSTNVDSSFSRSSTRTVRYYGGNSNLLAENGIQSWQPSVDRDPWLFSGKLTPISSLIKDPIKKSSMVLAVKQYVMEKYLVELLRLISFAKSKVPSSVLNTLEQRVVAMQQLSVLVESDVTALGHEVERHLVVPDWFRGQTQLCYKWRPDGHGGQCGGGAARRLCAKPDRMTPFYRDDTDGRSGGCRMQWGITSSGYESWFSSVRICYRWYPDGNGGQCGGGARRELCAGINGFSGEYRDDTDNRGGGCRMSWRLVVPGSAPLWMKTARLCFSWYPDGNGGQCGGPSRDLCATANSWTSYYRDDTDNRSGGCRMSWGIRLQL